MQVNPNTVHLTIYVAFCYGLGQEATIGTYGRRTSRGHTDYGLHQSWCDHQRISSVGHWPGVGEDGHGQPSSARSAGAGGGVLRDRAGVVYAVVLSGGVALFAGGQSSGCAILRPAVRVAGKSGISQARTRLGWEPLRQLHDELVKPVAVRSTRGAWYRDWRLVSLDGSTFDVADEKANEDAFSASRSQSRLQRLSADSLCVAGGERHARAVWQPDGWLPDRAKSRWPKRCSRA